MKEQFPSFSDGSVATYVTTVTPIRNSPGWTSDTRLAIWPELSTAEGGDHVTLVVIKFRSVLCITSLGHNTVGTSKSDKGEVKNKSTIIYISCSFSLKRRKKNKQRHQTLCFYFYTGYIVITFDRRNLQCSFPCKYPILYIAWYIHPCCSSSMTFILLCITIPQVLDGSCLDLLSSLFP